MRIAGFGGGVRFASTLLLLIVSLSLFAQQQASQITEIVVRGNRNVSTEFILARMRTRVGQPYVQTQLDQDKLALEQLGFFKAVDVRAVPLEGTAYRVTVDVSEFDVVKEIRIVGNTVVPTERILEVVTQQTNQPFNLASQRPSAEAIAKLYTDRGYFALVEQFEPLEESPGTLSIVIREMKVNSITIQGNTRTQDRVMRRLIKTRPGEAYNVQRFDNDLRRVLNTQWFEKVTPVERPSEEGFAMDLVVDVREARTGSVVFGLTLDPRSSFAGQVRVADSNFRGTGQSVGLNFLQAVAGGGASIELNYTNPFIDRHDTSMTVSLYSQLLYRFSGSSFGGSASPTDERYTERRTGLGLGFVRPIGEQTSASVGARYEGIRTSNLNNVNPNNFIRQDGSIFIGQLGLLRNTRDVDLDPSRGNWAQILIEPGFANITDIGGAVAQNTNILGRNNFLRNTLEYRHYFTNQPPRGRQLDAPRRVFAFRTRFGFISGNVPFAEQFFVGGADTVRGYQDDRYWGKNMFVANLEYRHPIQRAFNAIAFIDYGGAWGGYGTVGSFTQFDRAKMNLGYGVGVSFKTPLGPIRLDVGFNERGGSRTHFLIGTSF